MINSFYISKFDVGKDLDQLFKKVKMSNGSRGVRKVPKMCHVSFEWPLRLNLEY